MQKILLSREVEKELERVYGIIMNAFCDSTW